MALSKGSDLMSIDYHSTPLISSQSTTSSTSVVQTKPAESGSITSAGTAGEAYSNQQGGVARRPAPWNLDAIPDLLLTANGPDLPGFVYTAVTGVQPAVVSVCVAMRFFVCVRVCACVRLCVTG